METRKQRVTKEEIERARQFDLLSYLQQYEPDELVEIAPGVHSTKSHDSIKISNGMWYRWSRGYGGKSALDYLVRVREMGFVEAVQYLNGKTGFAPSAPTQKQQKPKGRVPFILPKRNANNDRVIQYLTARGIDRDLIDTCIAVDRLYEDERHNCVFVGVDQDDTPKYAMLRSSSPNSTFLREVLGSDKRYAFSILSGSGADKLYVFESAIDLLSYLTLQLMQNADISNTSYLALSGVYRVKEMKKLPLALSEILQRDPEIHSIHLCLDNDAAGREATKTLTEALAKDYAVYDRPPEQGKDYNEQLMKVLELEGVAVRGKEKEREER